MDQEHGDSWHLPPKGDPRNEEIQTRPLDLSCNSIILRHPCKCWVGTLQAFYVPDAEAPSTTRSSQHNREIPLTPFCPPSPMIAPNRSVFPQTPQIYPNPLAPITRQNYHYPPIPPIPPIAPIPPFTPFYPSSPNSLMNYPVCPQTALSGPQLQVTRPLNQPNPLAPLPDPKIQTKQPTLVPDPKPQPNLLPPLLDPKIQLPGPFAQPNPLALLPRIIPNPLSVLLDPKFYLNRLAPLPGSLIDSNLAPGQPNPLHRLPSTTFNPSPLAPLPGQIYDPQYFLAPRSDPINQFNPPAPRSDPNNQSNPPAPRSDPKVQTKSQAPQPGPNIQLASTTQQNDYFLPRTPLYQDTSLSPLNPLSPYSKTYQRCVQALLSSQMTPQRPDTSVHQHAPLYVRPPQFPLNMTEYLRFPETPQFTPAPPARQRKNKPRRKNDDAPAQSATKDNNNPVTRVSLPAKHASTCVSMPEQDGRKKKKLTDERSPVTMSTETTVTNFYQPTTIQTGSVAHHSNFNPYNMFPYGINTDYNSTMPYFAYAANNAPTVNTEHYNLPPITMYNYTTTSTSTVNQPSNIAPHQRQGH